MLYMGGEMADLQRLAGLNVAVRTTDRAPGASVPSWSHGRSTKALAWLASSGLRPTRQRLVLAELLVGDGCDRHVTAELLFAAARACGSQVSLATVYNTLKTFCHAGLLQEVKIDGTRSHFDTNTRQHPHFYWENNGEVTDAPSDQLQFSRLPAPPEGMEISSVDIVIRLRPTS